MVYRRRQGVHGFIAGALLLVGCANAPTENAPGPPPLKVVGLDGTPPAGAPHWPVKARAQLDLRAALGVPDAMLTGVAIDPQTGERYVTEATRGLYRLGSDGKAQLVWDASRGVTPPVTDVVAVAHGLFAVATPNDGYFIDVASGTIDGRFCYVPSGYSVFGGALPPDGNQLTQALALQPATSTDSSRIIAQPQTFDRGSGDLLASSFGFFDDRTGESLYWLQISQPDFEAQAMTVLADGTLLLGGSHGDLYAMDLTNPNYQFIADGYAYWPADLGIQMIAGLAVDSAAKSLLIVDGTSGILFEISLDDALPFRGGGGG
jgi:hypothetical protein